MLNGSADLDKVNEYVRAINFLDKNYMEDVDVIRKYADGLTKHTVLDIKSATSKIDCILGKYFNHFKSLDFTNY
jgi:hypothetical protein